MLYLERFNLPSDYIEIQFIRFENRTCFNTRQGVAATYIPKALPENITA